MLKIQQISADDITRRLLNEAPPQATWVFDCDGTLINGDIASMTAWALIRFGMAHAELLPKEFESFSKLPFGIWDFISGFVELNVRATAWLGLVWPEYWPGLGFYDQRQAKV